MEYFKIGRLAEKGYVMEILDYVSRDNQKIVVPCADFVMNYMNNEAPKIKWKACRIIANLAQKFPEKVKQSVPKLLANTKDKGTVVRWSAAFALTEIYEKYS
ncbi:MAG: hypothetical protein J7K72_02300 [Candidatus Aenigmarchaeota archaeon]|nr:hypothetical protein [Candidatus Aenigmarchaeota archaeon]